MGRTSMSLILLGLFSGAAIAIQSGVNARLRQELSSPLQAALVSFFVGTVALALVVALTARRWPEGAVAALPWWAWTGGLLGALYVSVAVLLAPRIGALALVGLGVSGQMLMAIVLDHFGWLGFSRLPISTPRVAGALLLLGGMLLVMRRGG
ncbi:MAG: DMT family transporter [Thermoanaerobaculia bacterium]